MQCDTRDHVLICMFTLAYNQIYLHVCLTAMLCDVICMTLITIVSCYLQLRAVLTQKLGENNVEILDVTFR